MTAAADLSTKQFYIVKLTAADAVNVTSATTDVATGVLQNKPKSGEAADVRRLGISQVISDGTTPIAVGDKLCSDTSGRAIKNTTVDRPVLGTALDASSATGTIIRVDLTPNCVYRTPA
jgi:hypothetical protein